MAEGVRAVEELLRSPLAVRGAILAPQLDEAPRGRALRAALVTHGVEIADVSHKEFSSASATDSPQGVLALAEVPTHTLESLLVDGRARFVVLDAVQDPGNVGTIVRTAAALGAVATIALPGTVDLWNPKVVRSAMGAQFHLPVLSCTWEVLRTFLHNRDVPLWGADSAGTPLGRNEVLSSPLAIAVGNEGAGLSDLVRSGAARLVSIPISPLAESLNVAVATGILLDALRP